MSKRKPKIKKAYFLIGLILILATGFHFYVMDQVHKMVNISVDFGSVASEQESQQSLKSHISQQKQTKAKKANALDLSEIQPFEEISAFDQDALDWGSMFDGYATAGVLIFDANGDGLEDVYLTHNSNNWTRPTDEKGILTEKPYKCPNGLYLNLGNDEKGKPRFSQIRYLAAGNETFVKEELLVEDYLFPRERLSDDVDRPGRYSSMATAADLNNDGRLDLLVGNILPGMLWSHPNTQRVLGQFVRPIGRQAINTKRPLRAQGIYFLKNYQAADDSQNSIASARGEEFFGANSIYLNMGDKDGDGLPEWKDVSKQAGLEGRRNTLAILVADFDLDGDLDVYEANTMDPDFWPGGSTRHAGGANQLYMNQLAETGELKFIEKAAEMDVDGVYDDANPMPDYYRLKRFPVVPEAYSIALKRFERYQPEFLEINGYTSEAAQISWASVVQDANDDGYPDIWVANDLGYLRLYLNKEGKKFEEVKNHARSKKTGFWMSLNPADFNLDGKEDVFAGNMGGGTMNLAMPMPDPHMLFSPVMTSATMAQQYFADRHSTFHAIIDGADYQREFATKIDHSTVLPPDASLPNNIRQFIPGGVKSDFDPDGLDPYEFTWGSTTIDIQNDGLQDLYWVGCLYGRGGGVFPIIGTGPGRLLVNTTTNPEALRFADLTAEHHLFNIQEMQYDRLVDEGYIYRKSPLQNWGKRSMVYSYDVSVWSFQGPGIAERITNHDMVQTAENGRAAIAADLNNDGYSDIIVRNSGGYDSRSSSSVNLKSKVEGKVQVIPSHDANYPTPTNYEAGSTRMFLNQYRENNWIKVVLVDDSPETFNRDAIGAKVIIDNQMQVKRSGSGGYISNAYVPMLYGLGDKAANRIEIHWPDKERTKTSLDLGGMKNGLLRISKTKGLLSWEPQGKRLAHDLPN